MSFPHLASLFPPTFAGRGGGGEFPASRSPSHPLAALPCGYWITLFLSLPCEALRGRKPSCLTHQRRVGIPSDTRAPEPFILVPGPGEIHNKYFFRERASPDSGYLWNVGRSWGSEQRNRISETLGAWEPAWSLVDSESHIRRMPFRKEEGLRVKTVSSAPLPQVRAHRCCLDYLSK